MDSNKKIVRNSTFFFIQQIFWTSAVQFLLAMLNGCIWAKEGNHSSKEKLKFNSTRVKHPSSSSMLEMSAEFTLKEKLIWSFIANLPHSDTMAMILLSKAKRSNLWSLRIWLSKLRGKNEHPETITIYFYAYSYFFIDIFLPLWKSSRE